MGKHSKSNIYTLKCPKCKFKTDSIGKMREHVLTEHPEQKGK